MFLLVLYELVVYLHISAVFLKGQTKEVPLTHFFPRNVDDLLSEMTNSEQVLHKIRLTQLLEWKLC